MTKEQLTKIIQTNSKELWFKREDLIEVLYPLIVADNKKEYNRGVEDGKIIAEHGTTMWQE